MPPRRTALRDEWLQYSRASLAESAAGTFTELTINLPVVVSQGFVIEAHSIEFEMPAITAADLTATDDEVTQYAALTKSSQTGSIRLANPDTIFAYQRQFLTVDIQTAEKAPVVVNDQIGALRYNLPEPVLIPFEQIYFGIHELNGSAVKTFGFRLGYKTVKLATNQLVELLQAATT